jgi:hypothetical protein
VNKIVKRACNAIALIWITIILLNIFSVHSFAVSKTMTYTFSKSTSQYRSETITIPGLVRITSMTVDTGNVTYSVNGNNVTITCRNGIYVDYDEDTNYISNYSLHTGEEYPPSYYYYSKSGYSGYLYLQSTKNDGYYEFKEVSKEFFKQQDNTRTDYYDANGNFLLTTFSLGSPDNPTMYINEDGYEGYIPKYDFETIQPRTRYDNPDGSYRYETTWRAYYIGTLTKTVEIWHDDYTGYYSGTVYGDTTYYYAYNVTINYISNSSPTVNIVSPTQNMIFSETSTSFVPVIAVSDPEGDTLTCKVFIDSETSPRDTKTISNTQTIQNVSFNALNLGSLSQGTHTMKFTVADSMITKEATVSFKVDKTAPVIGSVSVTSTNDSITISGSATDNMAIHDVPYRFYAGSNDSSWKTSNSHTFSNLPPNTQYQAKFVARDKVGHLSEKVQNIYTKALKPVISVGNANETSLVVSFSENNPSGTQYLISCGSQYVNAQGKLTTTPVWVAPQGKSITVSGLSPNTSYTFTAKAKNGDGIETETSDAKSGKTLALPPQILEFPETKQNSIKVVWPAVPGATRYDIEADGHVINNGTSNTYVHSGLQPETTHTYRVRVINSGGTGNWSALFSHSTLMDNPGMPVNIRYSFTRTEVTLTWDTALKASGYEVEVDGIVQDNGSSRTYTHYGLEPESTHTYRVRAKNSGGYSDWSDYIQVTTLPNPPAPPDQISTLITKNSIQIEWEPNIKADRYEIEVDGFIYNNGTSTKYLHDNLVPLTTHQYRIRGVNAGGTGEWSPVFSVTTHPYEPYTPENLLASSDRNSVTLTWYMAAYASSYEIEIDGATIVEVEELYYVHGELLPGTYHTYRVRSKNITGVSEWTSPVSISTSMDTGSAATAITNVAAIVTTDSIVLSWDAAAILCEYEIEVDGQLLDNGSNTVFSHTGLLPGTYHEYKIRVKNTEVPNDWCVVLTVSSLPEPPGRTNISDHYATNNSIQLWWEAVEGAVSYDIEADGELLANVTDITYVHEALLPGTAHQYRVRVRTLLDVSPWSELLEISTSTTTFEVVCPVGEVFDYTLLAINVQDFSNVKYVVTFNENDLEIVDLCTFTPADDKMQNGAIPGTNLTVNRSEGVIEFTITDNIAPGTCWSGELTTIRFRSKTGNATFIDFVEETN